MGLHIQNGSLRLGQEEPGEQRFVLGHGILDQSQCRDVHVSHAGRAKAAFQGRASSGDGAGQRAEPQAG